MEHWLDVRESTTSGAVVVTVTGEVDTATAPLLADRVARVRDARAVIVDLSGVRLLAAAGVTVLVTAHRACGGRGTPMWVVAPNRSARRALEACDLVSVLHVVAESPATTAAKLTDALETRASVDAAVGVLIARDGLDESGARAALVDQARRAKVSVRRHAAAIVSRVSGRTPGGARDPARREASSLYVDLVSAAWESESPEHRAHIVDLASALHRLGHRVVLHVRRTSPDGPDSETALAGFEVVRVPAGPATPLSRADLLPHLDEFASALDHEWTGRAPDVAHLHSWPSGLGLATRGTTVPLVQSFHGLEPSTGSSKVVELERLTALAADRVIAASSDEVLRLTRIGVPRARTSFVPRGVDTDLFTPDGPVAPRGTRPLVLALGDVAPHSGVDTAIEAMAAVPDAELLVVGPIRSAVPREDPEVARLVRLARGHDVARRLKFTGHVARRNLPALLRSADVVVRVPSHDPSGTGAAQAMACGVPVVTTAVGALADLGLDDLTGLLVQPDDPAALGQALRELLADPFRRQICAITSADRARTRYSWDRVAAEVETAYRKVARTAHADTTAKRT
ncbi:glycosyltransferase [Umezawaea sp.]|uniref:glycosyltransferase n=1 Tax=Umezawaea sp. TaxID=1955258 RepID=UPI002ED495BF